MPVKYKSNIKVLVDSFDALAISFNDMCDFVFNYDYTDSRTSGFLTKEDEEFQFRVIFLE